MNAERAFCLEGKLYGTQDLFNEQSVSLQGVASRDIKLENTLLDGSPRPLLKICDFGYSKVCLSNLRP